MRQNRILLRILLFAGLYLLALLTYRNALNIHYFHDDLQRVFTHPLQMLFNGFIAANPYDHFYRPIEQMVLASIQRIWGWNTLPIHLLHLFFHTCAAFLVFHILRVWKVSIVSAIAASVFVIISQVSSYAVISNNTFSQLSGTLFSGISLWLLYRYYENKEKQKTEWTYYLSTLFFFLAIVSKETTTGLPLGIALIIAITQDRDAALIVRLKQGTKQLLPFAVCVILYLILRIHAGGLTPSFNPAASTSYYSFNFGVNIVRNFLLFAFDAMLPVSSFMTQRAIFFHNYILLVPIFLFTCLVVFIICYALWRSPFRSRSKVLWVLLILSCFPVVFLSHDIGECYGYNMIIFLGVLFGIAVDYYLHNFKNRSFKAAVWIIFFLCAITNILGSDEKASAMRDMGDHAKIFLPQVIGYAKTLPLNNVMYLINPDASATPEFNYSKYSLSWFNVLDFTDNDNTIRFYSNRNDVGLRLSQNIGAYHDSVKIRPGIPFTCDPATLRIYPLEDTLKP